VTPASTRHGKRRLVSTPLLSSEAKIWTFAGPSVLVINELGYRRWTRPSGRAPAGTTRRPGGDGPHRQATQDGSAHRTVAELEADLTAWIQACNDDPKPFVWTKTADEIFASLAAYLHLINNSTFAVHAAAVAQACCTARISSWVGSIS
jgi:hypothetical protein